VYTLVYCKVSIVAEIPSSAVSEVTPDLQPGTARLIEVEGGRRGKEEA
jgi:hypothetical protein